MALRVITASGSTGSARDTLAGEQAVASGCGRGIIDLTDFSEDLRMVNKSSGYTYFQIKMEALETGDVHFWLY
jgi:hypothetical protein